MAVNMSINAFKNTLRNQGARPNLFYVEGTWPNAVKPSAAADFHFLCTGSSFPSSNLGTIDLKFRGRTIHLPGDRRYDDSWSVTVLNDEDFQYRKGFEDWINVLNDPDANVRNLYGQEMFKTWKVFQLDRSGNIIQGYEFVDAFPKTVSNIALNYETENSVETYNIDFAYQYHRRIDGLNTLTGTITAIGNLIGDIRNIARNIPGL